MTAFRTRALAIATAIAAPGCLLLVDLDEYAGGRRADDAGREASSSDAATEGDPLPPVVDAADETPSRRFVSCRDLKVSGTASNGIYRIDPDGDGVLPSIDVYCEMTIDGGGWTLIARSVTGGTGPFGWRVGAGTINDNATPYSLGGASLALAFTEVLVTAREGNAKAVAQPVYKLALASSNLVGRESTAVTGYLVTKLLGTCAATAPMSLTYAGHTTQADSYFFRANGAPTSVGLGPSGFDLGFADCTWSGTLHTLQGMLFVR